MPSAYCAFLYLLSLSIDDATGFIPNHGLKVATGTISGNTHISITKKGVLLAMEYYFIKKKAKKNRGFIETLANFFDTQHDESITEILRDYYGESCEIDVMRYVNAVQEITDGNQYVDLDHNTKDDPKYHFDNEQFVETNANIIRLRKIVVGGKSSGQIRRARKTLGIILHMVQDFYSHSNYPERFNRPSQGVGDPENRFELKIARPSERTCRSCYEHLTDGVCPDNIVTDKLTSGYYLSRDPLDVLIGQETEPNIKPSGKCSHGGILDATANERPRGGINKDSPNTFVSPRAFLHEKAVWLAERATAQFILGLRYEMRSVDFEELFRVRQKCHRRSIGRGKRSGNAEPNARVTKITVSQSNSQTGFPDYDSSNFHQVLIASATFNFSSNSLTIPVDSTVEDILIQATSAPELNRTLAIFLVSPKGNVSTFNFLQNNSSVTLKVEAPDPGLWRFKMIAKWKTDAVVNVSIYGLSKWYVVTSVKTVLNGIGHLNLPGFKILKPNEPLRIGEKIYIFVISSTKYANITRLELRKIDGSLIANSPVLLQTKVEKDVTECFFNATAPEGKFRLVIRAKDNKGHDAARISELVYVANEADQQLVGRERQQSPNLSTI